MPNVEFSFEELEVLREVLQHGIHEVDMEISRTDAIDFKQMLKHRKVVLDHALSKLPPEPVRVAA